MSRFTETMDRLDAESAAIEAAQPQRILIGTEITCQIGYESDSSGYREAARCVVLDLQNRNGQMTYLLQVQDDMALLCTGTMGSDTGAQMQSSSGRRFGGHLFPLMHDASASLGF
jgi:hypothetical protein